MNAPVIGWRLGSRGAALGVALLAAALRLPWLGRLGLQGDEDISTLAARGILEVGWPRLPSGHGYWRGPVYHYLVTPLVAFQVDWFPRLLAVAASVMTAYLLVRLGRRWVGENAAFVGGLLFAVSLLEIDLARQIRMYSLYQLCALLAFAACYRLWTESRFLWGALAALAVAVAMQVHLLGATLAALFVLVVVRTQRQTIRALCVATALAFVMLLPLQQSWSHDAHMGGRPPVAEPASKGETEGELFGRDPLAFGRDLLGTVPFFAWSGLLAAVFGGLAFAATRDRPPVARVAAAAGLASAAGLVGAHQIGLGFAILVLLVLQRPELFPDRAGGRVLLTAAAVALGVAALWVVAGITAGHGARDLALGLFGRHLGRFVRFLVSWPPAISILALAGSAGVLWRTWVGTARDGERFVTVVLVGLTAARSLLAGKWQERYLADVWPLWELLAGWGVVVVLAWLVALRPRAARRTAVAVGIGGASALVLILPGTSLVATHAYLARGPGEPPGFVKRVAGFAPDFRGVSDWLLPRLAPGDRVVATDWLSTYCYVGRVDGWIRSSGYGRQSVLIDGVTRDVYLGAEVLTDVAAIESFRAGGPIWIVAGGLEWTDAAKLAETTRSWLSAHEPVFVAADNWTRVYHLDRSPLEPAQDKASRP